MNKYILVTGDLITGFEFHGPFESEVSAAEYADKADAAAFGWLIAPLHAPEQL